MPVSAMTDNPIYNRYVADYSEADALTEVLRQTERHLEEQHKLTTSADQRAVAFASVLMVVIGILLSNDGAASVDASQPFVIIGFLTAIGLAFYSAKPTRIFGSGANSPSLKNHVGERREGYLVSTLIERNDRNIAHNDKVLKRSALLFRTALIAALASTLILFSDWVDLTTLVQQRSRP